MTPTQFRKYTLTDEQAGKLCAHHGLAAPLSVARVSKGEVSAVFYLDLVDHTNWVLKVYLRCQAPQQLVAEDAILQHLRRHSDLPVPAKSALCLDDDLLGAPYALHQRLPGAGADDVWPRLDRADSGILLRRCGELLARLHRVSQNGKGLTQAQVLPGQVWSERVEAEFCNALTRLRQQGWIDVDLLDRAEQVWQAGRDIRCEPYVPALCHGDFQLWNLLVDPETLEITGLLDVGGAYLGPAIVDARDLEINLFTDYPRLRSAFFTGYGVDPDEIERERLRQAALSRALDLMAAYWGPAQNVTPGKVWRLIAPWSEDFEE